MAQEAEIAAWRKGIDNPGYVMTAVYHSCVNLLRKNGRRPSVDYDPSDTPDSRDPFRETEQREVVEKLLSCLTERQRQCVELRHLQNMTYEEVGQRLGISASAVRNNLHFAMVKLRSRPA